MSDVTATDRASGDFERYGLLAALTLVVLCMLLADRIRNAAPQAVAPPADRLLRVRIGGEAGSPRRAVPGDRRAAAGVDDPPPAPRAIEPPASQLGRSCVVGAGETLGDISLRELGTSKRAREIADLNDIANVHQIRAGQTLRLPPR